MAVFVVHNVEEIALDMYGWELAHDLPGWMNAGRAFHTAIQLTTPKFIVIVAGLCFAIGGLAYLFRDSPKAARRWMTTYTVVMLAIFLGHLVTSIVARSPMPGVYSAVVLGLPVHAWVAYTLWRRS
jgi:hypothetical protein